MTSQALEKVSNDDTDIATLMATIGKQAKASARIVAKAPSEQKDKALEVASSELLKATDDILTANVLAVSYTHLTLPTICSV